MKSKINNYSDEVRGRWGSTDAYKESERRTANFSRKDWDELSEDLDGITKGFAALKADGISPGDEPARCQVEKLKGFITEKLYICTDVILSGLGEMYVADERFKNNINAHGTGTAEYIRDCIENFTKSR